MVNINQPALDRAFAALADPTRRAIVERLAARPATVSELAAPFDMSLPGVSKHLGVLENAGLLERRRQGRQVHCRLRADAMRQALAWLERYRWFWENQLDSLEQYLDEEDSP